ncbi:hypothetical protein A9Q86_10400 [Flavobacteriales bacterium 33_180_T64]|nr:hypothetical protein A9Q86_10400 [Flavobacteriales bacterium 33_180_T64]
MKTLLSTIFILLSISCFAQVTPTENYVHSIKYTESVNINNVQNNNASKIETVTYYDHINRKQQEIIINGNNIQTDIVQQFEYDGYGKLLYNYLPYAHSNNNGSFIPGATNNIYTFYNTKKYENTANPYSFQKIENSPRSRAQEIAFPGNDWEITLGHTVKHEYSKNSANDYIKNYGVAFISNNKETPELVDYGIYALGELEKYILKDENWSVGQPYQNDHTTEVFTDKFGRDVLKRNFEKGKWFDTYYIYDDFGNLTYVLPPKFSSYYNADQAYLQSDNAYFENITSFYDSKPLDYENEISINFNNGILYFNFYEYGVPEVPFDDGMVLQLNFNPPLPNMTLGDIMVDENGKGQWEVGAEAYIQNGNLYFNSVDIDVYEAEAEFQINLSNYQTSPTNNINELNELGYQYIYDHRNRVVGKKNPGMDWEYIVYDKQDRPVLVQDGKMRTENKWLFTKYDQLNRPIYAGFLNTSNSRSTLQNDVNLSSVQSETRVGLSIMIAGTSVYYSNVAYPTVNISELLNINYYDDYNWDVSSLTNPNIVQGQQVLGNPKGFLTGNKVRVLDESSWVTNVSYYDYKKRIVFVGSKNDYFNSLDKTEIELDFTGQQIKTLREHVKGTNPVLSIENNFIYDDWNRLVSQKQKINNGSEELIRKNHYDELGRLIKKDIGNSETQPLQEIDYEFNIRGWLKSINDSSHLSDDLFTFGINYQNPESPSSSSTYNKPQYNGNISHIMWMTDNNDNGLRHYSYEFDALNRFKKAYFGENHKVNNKYNEYVYNYDRNGNIEKLYRSMQNPNNTNYGIGIDFLNYSYVGNRLDEVRDNYNPSSSNGMEGFKDGNLNGLDFEYDVNGNMTKDNNKGISLIQYNYLNLPNAIYVSSSSGNNGTIRYVYDATGKKLSKEIVNNTPEGIQISSIDYVNEFIYETDSTGEKLKFFNHSEGYVEVFGVGDVEYNYFYQYKDHLGNNRLTFSDLNDDNNVTGATTEVFYDDFETSNGWDSQGALYGASLTYGGEHTKSGNVAGKLSSTSSVGIYVHSNLWIPISNSQTTDYIISGWVYSNGPGARFLLFMNEDQETGYYTLVESTETNNITDKWIYLEKRVSVPANIDKLNFRVDLSYGNPGTVWFDNASIRRVSNINEIEIVEENNYYPFGLNQKGYNDIVSANTNSIGSKFKFNSAELEKSLGVNLYEMDLRQYDPSIARWTSIDPVLHYSMSSYTAFDNNPVYWSDPSGADSYDYDYDIESNSGDFEMSGDYRPPNKHIYDIGTVWLDDDGLWIWDGTNWVGQGSTKLSYSGEYDSEISGLDDGTGNKEGATYYDLGSVVIDTANRLKEEGPGDWAQHLDKDNFEGGDPGDPKCSLYCGDVFKEMHVDFVELSNLRTGERPGTWWLYGLKGLKDKGPVPGFKKITDLNNLKPGDLLILHPDARSSGFGHAAIFISKGTNGWNVINAGHDIVKVTEDHPTFIAFRDSGNIAVWRYVGEY